MTSVPIVLGPQHPDQNLSAALAEVPEGPAVLITAGWRYDEPAVEALEEATGRACVHLPLFAWFHQVQREAPDLSRAYRARQDRVLATRETYRIRVAAGMSAVRQLLEKRPARPDIVQPQLDQAVAAVRQVDADYLALLDALDAEHPELARPWTQPKIARYHAHAIEGLHGASVVCIAGGHVAVLLNRLRFFGVDGLLRLSEVPIVAWSAGAMALTDRVLLFYDDAPDGWRDPELLGPGLGLIPGVVLLPHAGQRLRLGSRSRIATLALRCAPASCVALENGAWLEYDDGWRERGLSGTIGRLHPDGAVEGLA